MLLPVIKKARVKPKIKTNVIRWPPWEARSEGECSVQEGWDGILGESAPVGARESGNLHNCPELKRSCRTPPSG